MKCLLPNAIKSLSATAPGLTEAWLSVPLGLMVMLTFCFAVHVGLAAAGVQFPASVACLILLFAALLLSEVTLGNHRTRVVVNMIDVPVSVFLVVPCVERKRKKKTDKISAGRLGPPLDQHPLRAVLHPPPP